jgi:hypothetical protein
MPSKRSSNSKLKPTSVTTTKEYALKLSYDNIRECLSRLGYNVPSNASITVRVPGGGDWSNTDLDLQETQIDVRWTDTTRN